jgi:hypothetical protein
MDIGAVQVWDLCELGIDEALRISGNRALGECFWTPGWPEKP